MSSAFIPGGLYQWRALLPFSNQHLNYFGRNCRMVDGVDDHSFRPFGELANTASYRIAHLTGWIGIDSENDVGILEMFFQIFRSLTLTQNYHNSLNTTTA